MRKSLSLRPGDLVRVLSAPEIRKTLDAQGALDGLPFMPEMVQHCGKQFRVFRRIEKSCCDNPLMEMRSFPDNDVVFLEGVRCSGADHDGCGVGCMIFWKEAWLARVQPGDPANVSDEAERQSLRSSLRVTREDGSFLCQSTGLASATRFLDSKARAWKCVRDVWVGTRTPIEMIGWIILPLFKKIRRKARGEWPLGILNKTPSESLNLQPGEWVEIRPVQEIIQTLDSAGKNRGLHFSEDMALYCGRRFKVRNRLERMIVEADGKMRRVKDTVILEGVHCDCPFTFGGCPRASFQYWREIWLKRVEAREGATKQQQTETN